LPKYPHSDGSQGLVLWLIAILFGLAFSIFFFAIWRRRYLQRQQGHQRQERRAGNEEAGMAMGILSSRQAAERRRRCQEAEMRRRAEAEAEGRGEGPFGDEHRVQELN
jgi:hypothetical protein